MAIQFANNAATTLFNNLTANDTQMVVAPGGGTLFPQAGGSNYFMVTLVDVNGNVEIVKVTNRNADTFTIVRAQEGTTARAFPSGSAAELRLTAQSILDLSAVIVPRGIITMWSGSLDNVPAGWALCNGQNGTPNLQDRFVVGAGGTYGVGNSGGSWESQPAITVNAAATGVQVAGHALTVAQMPSHNHGVNAVISWEGGDVHNVGVQRGPAERPERYPTANTGSGQAHSHGIIDNGHAHTAYSAKFDNRPPYYALAYIMKL